MARTDGLSQTLADQEVPSRGEGDAFLDFHALHRIIFEEQKMR